MLTNTDIDETEHLLAYLDLRDVQTQTRQRRAVRINRPPTTLQAIINTSGKKLVNQLTTRQSVSQPVSLLNNQLTLAFAHPLIS